MKKNTLRWVQTFFPFLSLILLAVIFSFTTGQKLWSVNNLQTIVSTALPLVIGGLGMIFVVATGGCDISQGSTVALAGTVAAIACNGLGFAAYFPAAIIIGALVGIFNGVIVSKFKVQSLMVTLSMLIALRALVTYITNGQVIYVTATVLSLDDFTIKIPIFLALFAIMAYLFEYTKVGFFCKVLGENEVAGGYTGISTAKLKILAFMLSGIMAGIVGALTVSRIGGVDPSMGNFFELEVMMALFVGGIPVTGGMGSRIYKLVVGALTLSLLVDGLTLSKVSGEISELIEGLILILFVFFTLFVRTKFAKTQEIAEANSKS